MPPQRSGFRGAASLIGATQYHLEEGGSTEVGMRLQIGLTLATVFMALLTVATWKATKLN